MTITNSPLGKRARRATGSTAAPAPTRLPSARERRPALAALAVLLIVGGAVLAGWLALRQSHTEEYIFVINEVPLDSQIERGDLGTIELSSEDANFIRVDRLDEVVDSYAQGRLFPDQVLVAHMFGPAPTLDPDQARIGLDLRPNQYPPGLQTGDTVIVALLDDVTDSNTPVLVTEGSVRSMQPGETGGGAVVGVVLSSQCAEEFLSGSANGNVALGGVPASGALPLCQKPDED